MTNPIRYCQIIAVYLSLSKYLRLLYPSTFAFIFYRSIDSVCITPPNHFRLLVSVFSSNSVHCHLFVTIRQSQSRCRHLFHGFCYSLSGLPIKLVERSLWHSPSFSGLPHMKSTLNSSLLFIPSISRLFLDSDPSHYFVLDSCNDTLYMIRVTKPNVQVARQTQ